MGETKRGSLVRGISSELQDEILSFLIFDKEIYDSTKGIIHESFFFGDEYKLLFKALDNFHIVNKTNPTLRDIMIEVSLLVSNTTEKLKIKDLIKSLYADYIDEYINKEDAVKRNHFEEFIKRNGAEYCFSTIVEASRNDDGIDWMKIIPHFKKYTEFTIVESSPYQMGDIQNLRKIHEDAVGTNNNKKIRFFLDEINELMNHNAILPGTLTMVSASPGVGKSLVFVNQGVSATRDGFTSLHVFLGDLNKNSARLRYLANYSQMPLNRLINMPIEEQEELSTKINEESTYQGCLDKNWILDLPAGRTTVEQLCNEITKIQLQYNVHFDQIMIDYDANIKATSINIYESGGDIYNYLREFGIKNQSVMFVASQPKISFFNQEILTLDAASESSMKQHIVDLMITIGKPGRIQANIGTMYVPKNRDGRPNKKVWLDIDGARQTALSITEDEYEIIKRDALDD